jgi:hypothetical protein
LILTLHEKLSIDRCAIWEALEEEFDYIHEANMHDPVLEGTKVFEEPDVSLGELERLQKDGKGMTWNEMASVLADGV